jgi:hypothetical protein
MLPQTLPTGCRLVNHLVNQMVPQEPIPLVQVDPREGPCSKKRKIENCLGLPRGIQSHARGVGAIDDLLHVNAAQHDARLECPPPPLRLEPLPLFDAFFGDSMPPFEDILGSQDDFELFARWDVLQWVVMHLHTLE